jgi:hypothetical protein
MRTAHFFVRLLPLAALLTVAACSSSEDDAPGTEVNDYRAKPKGQDQNLAALTVKSPTEVDVELTNTPGSTLKSGATFTNLMPGVVPWSVTSSGKGIRSALFGASTLETGKTTVANIGGLKVTWGAPPRMLGFGTSLGVQSFAFSRPEAVGPYDFADGGKVTLSIDIEADGTSTVGAAPGRHFLAWGLGDGQTIDVEPGKVTSAKLASPKGRRLARIVPATRELPNGCTSQPNAIFTAQVSSYLGSYWGNGRFPEHVQDSLATPLVLGQNDAVLDEAAAVKRITLYETYRADGIIMTLPCTTGVRVPLGAVGAGAATFELGRVDVDDVEITKPNGSKESRRGSFSIWDETKTKQVTTQWIPTNTGLDLPPGKYTLVVAYADNQNAEQSYEEKFETP